MEIRKEHIELNMDLIEYGIEEGKLSPRDLAYLQDRAIELLMKIYVERIKEMTK